ncbi:hypothetical protein LOD99_5571 [Oopsacas minuta]|uniref:Endonuclease/exonuclease/phosphatase domain-containing protein n=1 Tax=Oopsacas minuta TaxID=111878 RepID=A0AAV7JR89_9METZ|nr:hypothetical protein LOD99_5571 [Oopsacas minuta]
METKLSIPFTFTVTTFNILAPIYKRQGVVKRECNYLDIYMKRNIEVLKVLAEVENPDVISLQELWLDKSLIGLFNDKYSEKYNFYHRTRSYQSEGIGLFINKKYKVDKVAEFNHPYSGRPFLFAFLNVCEGKQLIISTVHLTFCDEQERIMEIEVIIDTLKEMVKSPLVCGIIFTGDFNSTRDSIIIQKLLAAGLQSSYQVIHGQEPKITHRDHRGIESACDFVFFQALRGSEVKPVLSQVHPTCYSSETWPEEFTASDHRMISTEFHVH